ncbi:MAG: hypothetical protein MZV65_15840 [Chromatiales bacterium]|nr:hypothetical protein [Chromatiales bacterium]
MRLGLGNVKDEVDEERAFDGEGVERGWWHPDPGANYPVAAGPPGSGAPIGLPPGTRTSEETLSSGFDLGARSASWRTTVR